MFVLEAGLNGNFLDGKCGFSEQVAGADDPKFEQILVRAQAGMRGKGAAEPPVADAEFFGHELHVQVAREFILDAGNGQFDGIGALRFGGRLRLLRGVTQAEQIDRRAGKDLLERGEAGAN